MMPCLLLGGNVTVASCSQRQTLQRSSKTICGVSGAHLRASFNRQSGLASCSRSQTRIYAAVTVEAKAQKVPSFPFVKLAGQDEMKLAILLNVVDPGIGGVLIMGDRGTGKSVAVSPQTILDTLFECIQMRSLEFFPCTDY